MSYKITFLLVVIVTAWQGDLSRAFSEGGVFTFLINFNDAMSHLLIVKR